MANAKSPTTPTYTRSMTLTEHPSQDLLKTIYRHEKVWQPDRAMYRNYCDQAMRNGGTVAVKYVMKEEYGRYYVEDSRMKSATTQWRAVRASLFGETEYDCDIKSCHIQILINECGMAVPLVHLEKYVTDRDTVFNDIEINQEAIDRYNKDNNDCLEKKDLLKKLFTRILYGGIYENWLKEFNLDEDDVKVGPLYKDIVEDLNCGRNYILFGKEHQKHIKAIHHQIIEKARREHDEQQARECKRDKRKKPVAFDTSTVKICDRSVVSLFLQNRERQIIEKVFSYLQRKKKINPTAYCYDGFQILQKDVPDPDTFIAEINEVVKQDNVEFTIKPFGEGLDCSEIKPPDDLWSEQEYEQLITEEQKIGYFNKYNIKILSMDGYCYFDNDGNIRKIKNMQFHFGWIYDDFVSDYINKGRNIPTYFNYGIYPNKQLCPKQVYNLWTGFEVEKKEYADIEPDGDISEILYHFSVVANYDEKLKEYLLNYFAHLVQRPEVKTDVCLLIQGLQGTGKTTLGEILLKNMLGKKYVFDTCDVDKICGRFNAIVQGKLMGVLNEATGRDTHQIIDRIKDSITRKDVLLEHKGIDPVSVIDYCNYIYTTNNVNPVKLDKDDRRFQVIECSDKYKGNVEYFNKLYKALYDMKVIKTFYEFLKNRDISNWNAERDRVLTEAAEDIHYLNKCPVEEFYEYLWSDEFYKESKEYSMMSIYQKYKEFQTTRGFTNIMNIRTFGKLIKKFVSEEEGKQMRISRQSYGMKVEFGWAIDPCCHSEQFSD